MRERASGVLREGKRPGEGCRAERSPGGSERPTRAMGEHRARGRSTTGDPGRGEKEPLGSPGPGVRCPAKGQPGRSAGRRRRGRPGEWERVPYLFPAELPQADLQRLQRGLGLGAVHGDMGPPGGPAQLLPGTAGRAPLAPAPLPGTAPLGLTLRARAAGPPALSNRGRRGDPFGLLLGRRGGLARLRLFGGGGRGPWRLLGRGAALGLDPGRLHYQAAPLPGAPPAAVIAASHRAAPVAMIAQRVGNGRDGDRKGPINVKGNLASQPPLPWGNHRCEGRGVSPWLWSRDCGSGRHLCNGQKAVHLEG